VKDPLNYFLGTKEFRKRAAANLGIILRSDLSWPDQVTYAAQNNNNNNNNNLLQLGCYPVAVVILHVNKT